MLNLGKREVLVLEIISIGGLVIIKRFSEASYSLDVVVRRFSQIQWGNYLFLVGKFHFPLSLDTPSTIHGKLIIITVAFITITFCLFIMIISKFHGFFSRMNITNYMKTCTLKYKPYSNAT